MSIPNSSPPVNLPMNANVWFERLRRAEVPEHLHDGLMYYLAFHKPPGSFLRHVLENDLRGAVNRADEVSAAALSAIVRFLVNYAPIVAWGSAEAVEGWLANGAREESVPA